MTVQGWGNGGRLPDGTGSLMEPIPISADEEVLREMVRALPDDRLRNLCLASAMVFKTIKDETVRRGLWPAIVKGLPDGTAR